MVAYRCTCICNNCNRQGGGFQSACLFIFARLSRCCVKGCHSSTSLLIWKLLLPFGKRGRLKVFLFCMGLTWRFPFQFEISSTWVFICIPFEWECDVRWGNRTIRDRTLSVVVSFAFTKWDRGEDLFKDHWDHLGRGRLSSRIYWRRQRGEEMKCVK